MLRIGKRLPRAADGRTDLLGHDCRRRRRRRIFPRAATAAAPSRRIRRAGGAGGSGRSNNGTEENHRRRRLSAFESQEIGKITHSLTHLVEEYALRDVWDLRPFLPFGGGRGRVLSGGSLPRELSSKVKIKGVCAAPRVRRVCALSLSPSSSSLRPCGCPSASATCGQRASRGSRLSATAASPVPHALLRVQHWNQFSLSLFCCNEEGCDLEI